MILNNALGEPELNRLGLHQLSPGTRLASNMAPTTGRTTDGRVLAIGSPGADRITTALMQVLVQGCLRDADLQSAIEAPRVHVSFAPDGTARVTPLGSSVVRIVDGPAPAPDGSPLAHEGFGTELIDDEGVEVQNTVLVEAAGDPRRAAEVALLP